MKHGRKGVDLGRQVWFREETGWNLERRQVWFREETGLV